MSKIIITGGSKGIGLSLVEKFRQTHHVYTVSRTIENIRYLDNVTAIQGDITKQSDIEILINIIKNEQIDGIINNAAYYGMPEKLIDSTAEESYKFFETNFFAPIKLIKSILKTNNLNRVLNISSGAAEFPLENLFNYCTSKAAIHHAFKCLNFEYPTVKFANIRPGMVDTELQEKWRNVSSNIFPNGNYYQQAKEQNQLTSPNTVSEFIYKVWHTPIELFAKDWNINTDFI